MVHTWSPWAAQLPVYQSTSLPVYQSTSLPVYQCTRLPVFPSELFALHLPLSNSSNGTRIESRGEEEKYVAELWCTLGLHGLLSYLSTSLPVYQSTSLPVYQCTRLPVFPSELFALHLPLSNSSNGTRIKSRGEEEKYVAELCCTLGLHGLLSYLSTCLPVYLSTSCSTRKCFL